jgi:hypothetical protein
MADMNPLFLGYRAGKFILKLKGIAVPADISDFRLPIANWNPEPFKLEIGNRKLAIENPTLLEC